MTSWLGSTTRTHRMLLVRLAVLIFVVVLAACDQAAEAPEGERVIVDGIQKARPGMTVAASEAAPAQPESQPEQDSG